MTEELCVSEKTSADTEIRLAKTVPTDPPESKVYVVTWEATTPHDWQEQGIGMST